MIDAEILDGIFRIALLVQVALLLPCGWRAAVGPAIADRLLAIDMITTILIGIIVVLALIDGDEALIDIGIALSALSFIATLGLSRYISEGKVF